MEKYLFRKSYFINKEMAGIQIESKVVFKTQETGWVNTTSPCVILISIHSKFHEGLTGYMKMETLITLIKKSTRGPITLLMTEGAHLHTLGLIHENALEKCTQDAHLLVTRFRSLFRIYQLHYWTEYVTHHPMYTLFRAYLLKLYETNSEFQTRIIADAKATYTAERAQLYPNKTTYIEKTIQDIIEQGVGLFILLERGYQTQFYPGKQFTAIKYLFQPTQLQFIHVFIAIERKRITRLRDFL